MIKKLNQLLLFACLAGLFGEGAYAQEKSAPAILIPLFDGKTLNGWTGVPAREWTVADSAIAMTGSDRGVIYTNNKYSSYRIIFSVRQVKGVNHWPCVLVFGPDPKLDALGAIQFEIPKDYTWDYRPGKNNDGKAFFTHIGNIPGVNKSDWARCEILVDAATGTARSAAAQPIGSQAIEITDFGDTSIKNIPTPFAIQSHNKGQFDEYKDIMIEVNPKVNELLTVLKAPAGLKATVRSGTRIDLNWTDNANVEDGFKIERSADSLQWATIKTTAANATTYSNRHLSRKTRYYYRVSAFNAAVNSACTTASATTQ